MMTETVSYRKPLLYAIIINMVFLTLLALTVQIVGPVKAPEEHQPLQINMELYEKQGNDGIDAKSEPGGGSPRKSLAQQLQESPKPSTATPYVGGVDMNATVTTAGAASSGTIGSNGIGDGASSGSGEGMGNGVGTGTGDGVGDGDNHGHGYVDYAEYVGRLQASIVYPPQAIKRQQRGHVVYTVIFDAQGNVVSANLSSSSGHSILDKAAYRLIMNGGAITNTTGRSVTLDIPLTYDLN